MWVHPRPSRTGIVPLHRRSAPLHQGSVAFSLPLLCLLPARAARDGGELGAGVTGGEGPRAGSGRTATLPEPLAPSRSPRSRSPACPAASPGQSEPGVGEGFAPGSQEPLWAAEGAPETRVNPSGAAAGALSSSGRWARFSRSPQTPALWELFLQSQQSGGALSLPISLHARSVGVERLQPVAG